MTTTISGDLDANDRLRRARWETQPSTGAALLEALERAAVADDAVIQRLDDAQHEETTPKNA